MHMHANERYGGSRLMMCGATIKSTCKRCKKTFMHTSMHAYRGCCTYGCMREMDKADAKANPKGGWTQEKLEKRMEKCRERLGHFKAIYDDESVSKKKRSIARHSYREWVAKLEEAEEMLAMIEEAKNGKSVEVARDGE